MGRLRHTAAAQAQAEYGPQKRQARREGRSTVRSIRSEVAPLQAGIATAEHQLRHAGLSGYDLRVALSELANRNVDVASSAALQSQQAQQETHAQLVDLSQAEGQAQRSALATMQQAAIEHRQDLHDEIAAEQRGIGTAIRKAELEKRLGLGDYKNGSSGMTPTQLRALATEHHNAAFYAKSLFNAIKEGAKDKEGNRIDGPDPKQWSNKTWHLIAESVANRDGVNSTRVAQRAVHAIHAHIHTPAPALDILKMLAGVGATVAPVVAPKSISPIAQFGAALLHSGQ